MTDLPVDVADGDLNHTSHHNTLHGFYNTWRTYDPTAFDAATLEGSTLAEVLAAAVPAASGVVTATLTGDDVATSWDVAHNLGTSSVEVLLLRSDGTHIEEAEYGWAPTTGNTLNSTTITIAEWGSDGSAMPSGTSVLAFVQVALSSSQALADSGLFLLATNYGVEAGVASDQSAALQSCIDAANAQDRPAVIVLPAGNIYLTGQITSYDDLSFLGGGGKQGGSTKLDFLASTPSPCVVADGLQNNRWEGVQFSYRDGFAGTLCDFSGNGLLAQATHHQFVSCMFSSGSPGAFQTAEYLIDLEDSLGFGFTGCNFSGAQTLIRGLSSPSTFSNGHTWKDCQFANYTVVGIESPGDGWSLVGCVGEPRIVGGVLDAHLIETKNGVICDGLTVLGGWFGDAVDATTGDAWILGRYKGLNISGGHWGADGGAVFRAIGKCEAVRIKGASVAFDGSGDTASGCVVDYTDTTDPGTALSVGCEVMVGHKSNWANWSVYRDGVEPVGAITHRPSGEFTSSVGLRSEPVSRLADNYLNTAYFANGTPTSLPDINGSGTGTPTAITVTRGRAEFDGATSLISIDAAAQQPRALANDFTVAVRAGHDGASVSGGRMFADAPTAASTSQGLQIYHVNATGGVRFRLADGTNGIESITGTYPAVDNEPYLIVVAGVGNTVTFWIEGYGVVEQLDRSSLGDCTGASTPKLGVRGDGTAQFCEMSLQAFAQFDVGLSVQQMTALANELRTVEFAAAPLRGVPT